MVCYCGAICCVYGGFLLFWVLFILLAGLWLLLLFVSVGLFNSVVLVSCLGFVVFGFVVVCFLCIGLIVGLGCLICCGFGFRFEFTCLGLVVNCGGGCALLLSSCFIVVCGLLFCCVWWCD